MVQYPDGLTLGDNVDIGAFCYINAHYGIEIGDNVEIGSHSSIYSHNSIDSIKAKVVIQDGAKIGTHSTIMPGVTIGKNAVVGAYSFVKTDVPDNTLVVGVPARIKNIKLEGK